MTYLTNYNNESYKLHVQYVTGHTEDINGIWNVCLRYKDNFRIIIS